MPEMDDFFSIPQELLGMMARFADDSGLAANEIVGEALRDYLHRQAGADLYAILSAADTRIRQSPVLIVTMDAPRRVLIVKSPLQYQYRPALKYHVEINLSDPLYLGRVSVVLRSNDLHVQRRFFEFLVIWTGLEEDHFTGKHRLRKSENQMDAAHFHRRLHRLPKGEKLDSQKTGLAIGEYIAAFDTLLKLYLTTNCDAKQIEQGYIQLLQEGKLSI